MPDEFWAKFGEFLEAAGASGNYWEKEQGPCLEFGHIIYGVPAGGCLHLGT